MVQKKNFDQKAKPQNLEIGMEVLVLVPDKLCKLQPKWKSGFKVVKCLKDNNYLVQALNSSEKPVVMHVNRLKPFIQREQAQLLKIQSVIEPEITPIENWFELECNIGGGGLRKYKSRVF